MTPVEAGDGSGVNGGFADYRVLNLSPEAHSVTFTPMLNALDWDSMTVEERKARNEENVQHVDVSRIGTTLETSEFGGYELTGWDVTDGTVSISLKPYGWQAMGPYMELISEDDDALGELHGRIPETGETGNRLPFGHHVSQARLYDRRVRPDGVSYYAADDDELRGLTNYYRSAFGEYREEPDAAQTLSF